MERARELIRPHLDREGLIGIYVVGSSTRPYRDGVSDYDIELVVEDRAYEALEVHDIHTYEIDEGPPRRVDHELYVRSWTDFIGLIDSTRDLFHFAYQHAQILHDPSGRIATAVGRLATMTPEQQLERIRVHYGEMDFASRRLVKTLDRGGPVDVQLVAGERLRALTKLVFVVYGSWVPPHHWYSRELAQLDDPPTVVVQQGRTTAQAPSRDALDTLRVVVDDWLSSRGHEFHRDRDAYIQWAHCTPEGRKAFATWSTQ
jgi:hypothetical protein